MDSSFHHKGLYGRDLVGPLAYRLLNCLFHVDVTEWDWALLSFLTLTTDKHYPFPLGNRYIFMVFFSLFMSVSTIILFFCFFTKASIGKAPWIHLKMCIDHMACRKLPVGQTEMNWQSYAQKAKILLHELGDSSCSMSWGLAQGMWANSRRKMYLLKRWPNNLNIKHICKVSKSIQE